LEQTDRTYETIKAQVLGIMLILSAVIALTTALIYGINVGISYGVGACCGIVYFRMLAKSIDRLGGEGRGFGSPRLAIFIGVMIVALRWEKLAVLPVFLGFVTYKGAILLYAIRDLIRSSR